MKVKKTKRVFIFGETELPDPNPSLTPDEVIEFYSNQYPELINSNFSEEFDEEKLTTTYTIKALNGTKG